MSNPNKVGLVFAILLGGWHLVWSLFVATGLGQLLYDFILWAHMIHLAVTIGPFDFTASIDRTPLSGPGGMLVESSLLRQRGRRSRST